MTLLHAGMSLLHDALRQLHVVAASIALLSGTVALCALKGAKLHRKSGILFVCAMLVMSASGALLAARQNNVGNVVAGVLTFYLVVTALLTVRRPGLASRRIDVLATLVALTLGLVAVTFGVQALASGSGVKHEIPAPVHFTFGGVALLATLGDVRVLRGRSLQGPRRLARHLWRMCFAFFIAAASFFLGPPQRLPAPLRNSPLRPLPVLLVLLVMLYWLVRVKFGKRYARASDGSTPAIVDGALARTCSPLRSQRDER
jgi:uncharacterized membrane protein